MTRNILTILFLFFSFSLYAQIEKELPPRPSPPRLVSDFTGTLSADQTQALENKLVAFDDSTSSQIAIVIVETTKERDIADYAVALGRAWGIGNKNTNNGVLLLVAKQDRKMFIATGYGLEGALPDVTSKRIIENEIKPNFRENDFYRGLDEGTDAIMKAIKGEYTAPEGYRNKDGEGGFPLILIFIIIFVLFNIIRKGGGGGGYYHGRGRHRIPGGIWFFPSGGGSFGSGSSSGGGFGGFGGGSFGGGGSGGSW